MKKVFATLTFLAAGLTCNAQDFIKPIWGEGLYGSVIEVNDSSVVFKNDMNEGKYLPVSNLEFIEYQKTGIEYYHPQTQKWINAADLEECLLLEGKNVYIPINHTTLEEYYMSRRLRELIRDDAYWNVVDSPKEAHFIMRPYFSYKRNQQAWMVLTDQEGNTIYKSFVVSAHGPRPSYVGIEGAYNLFDRVITEVKKKPFTIFNSYQKRKLERL